MNDRDLQAPRTQAGPAMRFFVSLVLFVVACCWVLLTWLLWVACENECNTDEQLPFLIALMGLVPAGLMLRYSVSSPRRSRRWLLVALAVYATSAIVGELAHG